MRIQSIRGNLYNISQNNQWCTIIAYFCFSFISVVYYTYCLQAFYRLIRVVFYKKKFLKSYSIYVFLCILTWLIGFLVILPLLTLNTIEYLPNDYYCHLPFHNFPVITYGFLIIYILPICLVSIIYRWIVVSVRRPLLNKPIIRLQNMRDFKIVKKIYLNISSVILSAFIGLIFLIISWLTGHLNSMTYCLGWLCASFSFLFQSLIVIYSTPQLENICKQFMTRNFYTLPNTT
ncbi:unnamed protein product [Didymodactylos carnosus]|uniref:G-protein coupled receptors family 1 profile domain-containing protein n=1 Tax=Didymodactylos carnosus TaxID=1234261 RepID=A0A8S2NZU7_9BILA|nr:unnamed protein product [Didymodactylos carnosus]CAF4027369.1 unnamed protein product [Didymodactylos carnosus]